MTISNRSAQAFIIGAMLLLAVALLIVLSVDLLPAPPTARTMGCRSRKGPVDEQRHSTGCSYPEHDVPDHGASPCRRPAAANAARMHEQRPLPFAIVRNGRGLPPPIGGRTSLVWVASRTEA